MNYAALKKTDIANGTGIRVSLFVSGCRRHCKGCFNSETWDFNFGTPFTDDTMQEILSALDHEYIEGFSLLGGEPFEPENRGEVQRILTTVREKFPQKTIWCYTGNRYENMIREAKEIIELLDVLIDGEFVEEKKNLRLKFRGSENQRIIDVKKSLESGCVVEME